MKYFLTIFASIALFAGGLFAQSGDPLPFDKNPLYAATAPVNGTNEIQTITIGGTPAAGSFTLTFRGKTTAAITWSATNGTLVSNIDTALEALATIGTSGVTTAVDTMTAGIGTITVTFTGNNAKLDVALMTGVSSLTGSSPTLAIATTTAGVTADGRSQAKRGTLLVARDSGALYVNTSGTALNPTWVKMSSISSTDTLTNKTLTTPVLGVATGTSLAVSGLLTSSSPTAGIGYATGAGGAVTQGTNRTTGVTLNTASGAITLISAAGSATPASFTVTNSAVAATDVVQVSQKSGTDLYEVFVTNVAAGSFKITSFTTGGTTTETPVFNFIVLKAVAN